MNSYSRLDPGTIITFEHRGTQYVGEVLSAHNYGDADNPNWYIEWKNEETGRSGYWKQAEDGGELVGIDFVCNVHDRLFSYNGDCEMCLNESEIPGEWEDRADPGPFPDDQPAYEEGM